MKNREKYRDEILNSVFRGNGDEYCKFVKKNVLPNLTDCTNGECEELYACGLCRDIFAFWLDEEYTEPPKPEVDWSNVPVDTLVRVRDDEEEPEVDWGKVPVDTLVRVRDDEDEYWILRYFKGINDNHLRQRYEAWKSGETSKTANGEYLCWNYCELVEDEK